MLTLIVDFENNKKKISLLDSKSFCLPGISKTEQINETIQKYLNDFEFMRYYIQHQNMIDRISCCYFSFKLIHLALQTAHFSDFIAKIPEPNTFVLTCKNLLTIEDELNLSNKIKSYYSYLE